MMLTDGSLKVLQAGELITESIALSPETSSLGASQVQNGIEPIQPQFSCSFDGCGKIFASSSQLTVCIIMF